MLGASRGDSRGAPSVSGRRDPGANRAGTAMSDRSVHELLQQLHQALEDKPALAAEDRELLRRLAADIQAALGSADAAPAGGLADRLQEAVTRFEVTHPDLTATMARAAKTLGDMGI